MIKKRFRTKDPDPAWDLYKNSHGPLSIEKYFMTRNFENIRYYPRVMAG